MTKLSKKFLLSVVAVLAVVFLAFGAVACQRVQDSESDGSDSVVDDSSSGGSSVVDEEGSIANPKAAVNGDNVQDSFSEVYYVYTAQADGDLSISFGGIYAGAYAFIYSDASFDDAYLVDSVRGDAVWASEVEAGDVIYILVSSVRHLDEDVVLSVGFVEKVIPQLAVDGSVSVSVGVGADNAAELALVVEEAGKYTLALTPSLADGNAVFNAVVGGVTYVIDASVGFSVDLDLEAGVTEISIYSDGEVFADVAVALSVYVKVVPSVELGGSVEVSVGVGADNAAELNLVVAEAGKYTLTLTVSPADGYAMFTVVAGEPYAAEGNTIDLDLEAGSNAISIYSDTELTGSVTVSLAVYVEPVVDIVLELDYPTEIVIPAGGSVEVTLSYSLPYGYYLIVLGGDDADKVSISYTYGDPIVAGESFEADPGLVILFSSVEGATVTATLYEGEAPSSGNTYNVTIDGAPVAVTIPVDENGNISEVTLLLNPVPFDNGTYTIKFANVQGEGAALINISVMNFNAELVSLGTVGSWDGNFTGGEAIIEIPMFTTQITLNGYGDFGLPYELVIDVSIETYVSDAPEGGYEFPVVVSPSWWIQPTSLSGVKPGWYTVTVTNYPGTPEYKFNFNGSSNDDDPDLNAANGYSAVALVSKYSPNIYVYSFGNSNDNITIQLAPTDGYTNSAQIGASFAPDSVDISGVVPGSYVLTVIDYPDVDGSLEFKVGFNGMANDDSDLTLNFANSYSVTIQIAEDTNSIFFYAFDTGYYGEITFALTPVEKPDVPESVPGESLGNPYIIDTAEGVHKLPEGLRNMYVRIDSVAYADAQHIITFAENSGITVYVADIYGSTEVQIETGNVIDLTNGPTYLHIVSLIDIVFTISVKEDSLVGTHTLPEGVNSVVLSLPSGDPNVKYVVNFADGMMINIVDPYGEDDDISLVSGGVVTLSANGNIFLYVWSATGEISFEIKVQEA